MKYFSVCSGIAGFECGIERAVKEWECVGFSEIDKYANAIYNFHYPKHKNYGDITKITIPELPDFNILVGGFPCQSFSIAGKRQGFKDTRGTIFFNIAQICKVKQPEWVLLENVKGLLSHESGKTIARIYQILTELGYTVGWEVVNSCQFGVPQNRERIFIIGHLTETGGRTGEILPIRKKDKRPSKGTIKTPIARCFTAGGNSGGLHSSMTLIQNKFTAKGNAYCLTPNYNKGLHSINKNKHTHVVEKKQVKSGTWRTPKDGEGFRELENPDISPCIPARAREDGSGQPVIMNYYEYKDKPPKEHDIVPTLKAESHGHQPMVKAVLTTDRLEKRQNGRRFKENDGSSFKLTSQDKHGVQKGFNIRRFTPIECERLQGFTDDWTKFGIIDGETIEISDTQRYKTLGNAVTVNVVEAIIKKMDAVFN